MAEVIADKVIQYCATTGTGTYTLGAVAGSNRTWRSKFVTGKTVVYMARRTDGTKWELGSGVLTHGGTDTLTRATIYDSSDGGSAVNWAADDANYIVFSPQSNLIVDGLVTEHEGASAPAWLPAKGTWRDNTAGAAVRAIRKLRKTFGDATSDIELGRLEYTPNIYQPSPRRYWVDNGTSNLTMTADHIGRVIKFDCSASGRVYTLLAGAATGIGHGFTTYIFPYGNTNGVQLVPNGSETIDGGAAGISATVPSGRITAVTWDAITGAWKTDLSASPVYNPGCRVTLQTGEAVHSTDYTGKTTVYLTPYIVGGAIPIRCGSGFAMFPFTELSNDITQSATGKSGPAAAGPYQVSDVYCWADAGTLRFTRSEKWVASATATITIATPGVVTWASHGLWDGCTVRFTTTGALPTGLTASTDYFVTLVDANSFKLSTTLANQVAGTFIATSGSQSGTHTAFNYTTRRGTGASTAELDTVMGIKVNKYAITNGPAAGQGTYVGTIYCNGSSQVDFKMGSAAAGGGEAIIGIWNVYNRVKCPVSVVDTTASWTYPAASAWRAANLSPTNRFTIVQGMNDEAVNLTNVVAASSALGNLGVGIGSCSTSSASGVVGYKDGPEGDTVVGAYSGLIGIGLKYLTMLEYSTVNTATFMSGTSANKRSGLQGAVSY